MLTPDEVSMNGRKSLDDLLDGVEALGNRIRGAVQLEAQAPHQHLPADLVNEVVTWRRGLRRAIEHLAETRRSPDLSDWRRRVDSVLVRIEKRVEDILNNANEQSLSLEQRANIYRHLGEYRALSEAVVSVAERATQINWDRIEEARL